MKLLHKLIIGFLLVASLIWVAGYFAIDISQKLLRDRFISSNRIMARDMLHQLDQYVQGKIEVYQAYATDQILRDSLLRSNREFAEINDIDTYITNTDKAWVSPSEDLSSPLVSRLINNKLSGELIKKSQFYRKKYNRDVISEVFVTNKYGAVIALTNKTSDYRQDDEEWWQKARDNGIHIQDIARDRSAGVYAIDVSIRVTDDDSGGGFIGIMKVVLNSGEISNILYDFEESEQHFDHKSMQFYLADGDGKLIYSTRHDMTFLSDISYLLPGKGDISSGPGQDNISDSIITDKRTGRDLFIVYAHSTGFRDYKGLGWYLVLEHDAAEVFAPIAALRNRIWTISMAVTLFAVFMGILFSTNIVRSIRKLRDTAACIGRGELDTEISITSKDEIGQLAREFTYMRDNLKNTTVKLDEFAREVADRKKTEELLMQAKQDWAETFDTITDIITVHDKEYNIIQANRAAKKILNIPGNVFSKKIKCFSHYHGADRPPEGCPSCDCLKTGEPAVFEIFEPHLNAYVEIKSIPRFDSDNRLIGLIHVAHDISKRKQNEELIQTQLNRLGALRSIDKAIIGSIDLRMTLDIFLEQVRTQLHVDAASVLMLNKHTGILKYVISKGFRSEALKYTKLKLGESNAGQAAAEQRIVSIPDLGKNQHGFASSEQFAAENFVSYFALPLISRGQVKGVLEIFHRAPLEADPDWIEFLEAIADQGAIAIDNATLFDEIQRSNIELTLAYDNTIEGWSRAMDLRDKETEGHSQRVTEMTLHIAGRSEIKDAEFVHIKRGALLHDIGKIGVPDNILLKPGKLTEDEWITMKRHPQYAYDMLYPIDYLRPSIDIPFCHHEKWDGTGYPRGLKGEDIPLAARIFAVVDVWDALHSDRPYRSAWPKEKVLAHIRSLSGTHFDPAVVEAFLDIYAATPELVRRS